MTETHLAIDLPPLDAAGLIVLGSASVNLTSLAASADSTCRCRQREQARRQHVRARGYCPAHVTLLSARTASTNRFALVPRPRRVRSAQIPRDMEEKDGWGPVVTPTFG